MKPPLIELRDHGSMRKRMSAECISVHGGEARAHLAHSPNDAHRPHKQAISEEQTPVPSGDKRRDRINLLIAISPSGGRASGVQLVRVASS